MKVKIKYLGPIKNITGVASEKIEVPTGFSIDGLLGLLIRRHGEEFKSLFIYNTFNHISQNPQIRFFKDGKMLMSEEKLHDMDEVIIIKMVTGG